jgi:hypothetical protein
MQSALDTAAAALQKAVLPQKPAGVSDVVIVDAAQRLQGLLPKSAEALMTVVPRLITQAGNEHDTLTLWLLAGPDSPLQIIYKSIDFSRTAAGLAGFSQSIVQAYGLSAGTEASTLPKRTGEALAAVCSGGNGTLRGCLAVATTDLYQWRLSVQSYMAMIDPQRYAPPPTR